ncbi:MAG: LPS-assembly protein LptD [Bacteroidales bacterium]|nr:LPS-assembly protein LptD [Bacteroidales bacterium]
MIILLLLLPLIKASGQVAVSVPDSLNIVTDTTAVVQDTLLLTRISSDAIDATVGYKAKGYKKNDLANGKVYLIDEAEVTYQNIFLKADSIVMDMELGTIFASGRRDSTGNISGKVEFREGEESYQVDQLEYNFKSTRALIRNVVTRQQEGFLHSSLTKKQDDGTLHFKASSFTTCDAEHPHFFIAMPRAKVYPDEKIVSGPAYLVVEDIPLPLILPFGYFPVQKKLASGIIMPRYGQEQQRGYFLSEGGYYFAGTEYFDLKTTGNIYANGTWMASATSRYNVRYRFSGSLSFSYANNISGHKGLPDYAKSKNYRIGWTHSQDPKANPGARLSANVNMSSSSFDRNNTYQPLENVTTQRQSSVSYSKTWAGTPFNFAASINHSQNNANKTVSLNLPRATLNMSRIYPLKSRKNSGPSKWYQDLQLQYTAQLDNQINTYDSLLFTNQVWKSARAGFKHDIPVSLQIRPFNNFNISPSLRYTGVLYPSRVEKFWIPDYFDPELNEVVPRLVIDTINGISYGHAINPSVSAGYSPQIFGYFSFKKPGSRLQQVRHVIKPSVSFSFIPSVKGLSSPMYREVQVDTIGTVRTYSIYETGIFGTPSLSQRSGSISLSLVNILEAKIFERNDTTGKASKVKLIENLGFGTSYNIFSDSLNWAPISMTFRTILFDQIGISANGSFSLYGTDSNGKTIGKYLIQTSNKLMRLQNFSTSVDFDLGRLFGAGKKKSNKTNMEGSTSEGGNPAAPDEFASPDAADGSGSSILSTPTGLQFDEFGYAIIDLPWTLGVAYNFTYTKTLSKPIITQQFTLNGTLKIATKTNIDYVTGFDVARKEITMTRIGIRRDLHCWNMSFNWIPTGYLKSWDFTIRINSGMLSDIKYERRKDYRENF